MRNNSVVVTSRFTTQSYAMRISMGICHFKYEVYYPEIQATSNMLY